MIDKKWYVFSYNDLPAEYFITADTNISYDPEIVANNMSQEVAEYIVNLHNKSLEAKDVRD